jgi:hypothetical protein
MAIGEPEVVPTGWRIPLAGGTVCRLSIEFPFGILISVSPTVFVDLRIENEFEYSDGTITELFRWEHPSELGRYASLWGAELSSADLSRDGNLELRFADDRRLKVAPEDAWEAWQISSDRSLTDGGWKFISLPGGGLAEWLPDD